MNLILSDFLDRVEDFNYQIKTYNHELFFGTELI